VGYSRTEGFLFMMEDSPAFTFTHIEREAGWLQKSIDIKSASLECQLLQNFILGYRYRFIIPSVITATAN
jgi:hypothetical protein